MHVTVYWTSVISSEAAMDLRFTIILGDLYCLWVHGMGGGGGGGGLLSPSIGWVFV